jgi:predicted Rossmann fold nucleotide-binding protein DprA/Smf involved in DNA uptake
VGLALEGTNNWRGIMGELEKELRKISSTLNDLARKLDQVTMKAVGRPKAVSKAPKKPQKKARPRKSGHEVIMALIKAKKNGVDTATLRAKTGFSGQKVRSAVWELSKKGKIKRVAKGLYKIGK